MNAQSSNIKRLSRFVTAMAAAALLLQGCGGGSDGSTGPAGPAGATGPVSTVPGPAGQDATAVTKVSALTADQWVNMNWTATITSATIGTDGKPVVNFKVVDDQGKPVIGLAYPSLNTINSTATLPAYANFGFTIAKLVPGNPVTRSDGTTTKTPNRWVSYIVTSTPTFKSATDHSTGTNPAAQRSPTTDNQGTMVDNGDGTYKYTFVRAITAAKAMVDAGTYTGNNIKAFLDDTTYAPALTHRVAMQLQGAMPGTGTNTPDGITVKPTVSSTNPVAAYLDFVPAGGSVTEARTITRVEVCQSCHKGNLLHGRKDPNLCVVCHTNQAGYGYADVAFPAGDLNVATSDNSTNVDGVSTVTFPRWVHRIHMGEGLAKKGYNVRGVLFNEVAFPQDQRNCVKCHDSSATAKYPTPNGDNWKNVPSRLACGGCHDGINFATGGGKQLSGGANHLAGVGLTDDARCASCHLPSDIEAFHIPVSPIAASILALPAGSTATGYTNAASIAAYDKLPTGAIKVSYDIGTVTVSSAGVASMTFKLLQNGVATPFNAASATAELWPNFVGGPGVELAFNVPEDGITAPADYNAHYDVPLRGIFRGTGTGTSAGTLTYDAASGYYTVTLTGIKVPSTATMVTMGLGYTYAPQTTALPLTQTNLAKYPYNATTLIGGLIVEVPNAWKVASGKTSRRMLVEDARCNTCHAKLGVFAESAYHAGQRNSSQTCAFCHNPNQTSGGWTASSNYFVHAIHGATKRSVQNTWHYPDINVWGIGNPGNIKNCAACHLPGAINFGTVYTKTSSFDVNPLSSSIINSTSSASAVTTFNNNFDNRLYVTVATGTYTVASTAGATGGPAPTSVTSPYVALNNDYGVGFAYAPTTGVSTNAAATTLVNSPTTNACFSCHDTAKAQQHMTANGGSIYAPRAAALAKAEQCLLCHAGGKIADVEVVHQ